MASSMQKFAQGFHEIVRAATTLGILLAILAMFYSAFVLVSLTSTQVSVSFGWSPVFKSHTDGVLNLLGFKAADMSNQQYVSVLSALVGSMAVVVTLWFAIATLLKYIEQRRELANKAVIKKEIVHLDGKDDLAIMLRYFKDADAVTVFSGDFSWLLVDEKLRFQVNRLVRERKISFVSYKDELIVRNSVGQLYDQFAPYFRYEPSCRLKCSLVTINQTRVFLYKVDTTAEGGDKSVCIVSSKDEARYLLETLNTLCARYITRPA